MDLNKIGLINPVERIYRVKCNRNKKSPFVKQTENKQIKSNEVQLYDVLLFKKERIQS